MLRRLRPLFVALALTAPFLVTPAPASATACVGTFSMSVYTDGPFGHVGLSENRTGSFNLANSPGSTACAAGGISGAGSVGGQCGAAWGFGTANNGEYFDFTWSGTTIWFSGGLTGSAQVVEEPILDCAGDGATAFILTGVVAFTP